jgi:hypothetical protein
MLHFHDTAEAVASLTAISLTQLSHRYCVGEIDDDMRRELQTTDGDVTTRVVRNQRVTRTDE